MNKKSGKKKTGTRKPVKKVLTEEQKRKVQKQERQEQWEELFAEGKRMKWGKARCRKYVEECGGTLAIAVAKIKEERRVEEQPLGDLLEWRQTAINRLLERKEVVNGIFEEFDELLQRMLKEKKKHDSDLKWLDKLETALSADGNIIAFKTDKDFRNSLDLTPYWVQKDDDSYVEFMRKKIYTALSVPMSLVEPIHK